MRLQRLAIKKTGEIVIYILQFTDELQNSPFTFTRRDENTDAQHASKERTAYTEIVLPLCFEFLQVIAPDTHLESGNEKQVKITDSPLC